MNTQRTPSAWLALQPGDFIHSTAPRDRLEAYVSGLADAGYVFALEKSPTGHYVMCRRAPPTTERKDP